MKQLSTSKAWALIAEIGWGTRTTDYKHVAETYFELLGEVKMNQLEKFVSARVADLGKVVADCEKENGDKFEVGSDDGFSDLRYHVVGMGKDEFDACMACPSKMETRYANGDYKESFAYCFQVPDPPRTKEEKQKDLRDMLVEIKVIAADIGRMQNQVDTLRCRMNLISNLAAQVSEDLKADWK